MRFIVWPARGRAKPFDMRRKGGYRAGTLTSYGGNEFVCINDYIGEAVWPDPARSALWARVMR